MMPSETKKPAASSSSSPGVRMVTAMEGLSTRISKGSSPASSSSNRRGAEPFSQCQSFAAQFFTSVRGEFVTDAVDGEQMSRFTAVVTDFFSQLHDDLIERAGRPKIIVTPDIVEQTVAGENLAGVSVKKLQHFQFLRGQFLAGFAAVHLKRFWINGGSSNFERGVILVFIRCTRHLGSAQYRMNPRQQFPHAKWLGHIIVGTQIKADHLVDLLPLGRQHEIDKVVGLD